MRPAWPVVFLLAVGPYVSAYNCNDVACLNGGTCNVTTGICECDGKSTGPLCSVGKTITACASNHCIHGYCFENPNARDGYKCICDKRFEGDLCDVDKDECELHPCSSHGSECINHVPKNGSTPSEDRGYSCKCTSAYEGLNCEHKVDLCSTTGKYNSTNPYCQNGADCESNLCLCLEGWGGDTCERAVPFKHELIEDGCGLFNNTWEYCLKHFADGVCDTMCRAESCMFDGLDCAKKDSEQGELRPLLCPLPELCPRVYGDGKCNKECDTFECRFDGGDCEGTGYIPSLDNRVIGLVVNATPFQVVHNLRELQYEIGQHLYNARVRVASDSAGYLIFEWDSAAPVSTGWLTEYANSQTYGKRLFPNMNRPKTWGELSNATETMIYFDIDTDSCHKLSSNTRVRREYGTGNSSGPNCFEDVRNAARYLNVTLARANVIIGGSLKITGVHYHYGEAPPWRYVLPWAGLAIVVLFFLLVVAGFLGIIRVTTRKRKEIFAPVWTVPSDFDYHSSTPPISPIKSAEVPAAGKRSRLSDCVYPCPLENDPPLLAAVRRGDSRSVSEIISSLNGQDIDLLDGQGLGALHHAIANNDVDVLSILLQSGGFDVFNKNRLGQSAIVYASRVGHRHLECYCLLVQEIGMRRVNINNNHAGRSYYPDKSMSPPLSDEYDVRWALTDDMGRNSIHYAAVNNLGDVIQYMHAYGADVNLVDDQGSTPMHLACRGGRLEAVDALLECNANPNITDAEGRCPVQLAEQRGYWSIVYLLRHMKMEEVPPPSVTRSLHRLKRPSHMMMSPVQCPIPPRRESQGYFSMDGSGNRSDMMIRSNTTLTIPLADGPPSVLDQMRRESDICGEVWKTPRLDMTSPVDGSLGRPTGYSSGTVRSQSGLSILTPPHQVLGLGAPSFHANTLPSKYESVDDVYAVIVTPNRPPADPRRNNHMINYQSRTEHLSCSEQSPKLPTVNSFKPVA